MSTLSPTAKKAVAEELNILLASSYVLMLKTHGYHWNVKGPHFHALHQLFQEQYEDLFEAIDEFAERIKALGHKAPATFSEYKGLSVITEDDSEEKDMGMVKNLLKDHQKMGDTLRKMTAHVQGEGDEATADMMIARTQVHDKFAWMLESHLTG